MRKVVDYKLVVTPMGDLGVPFKEHEEKVRRMIADGWEPQGGLVIDSGQRQRDQSVYVVLAQAMVKYEPAPHEDREGSALEAAGFRRLMK